MCSCRGKKFVFNDISCLIIRLRTLKTQYRHKIYKIQISPNLLKTYHKCKIKILFILGQTVCSLIFFFFNLKNYISFAQNYDVSANMQGALSGTSASLSVGNGDIKHFCITSQSQNVFLIIWPIWVRGIHHEGTQSHGSLIIDQHPAAIFCLKRSFKRVSCFLDFYFQATVGEVVGSKGSWFLVLV